MKLTRFTCILVLLALWIHPGSAAVPAPEKLLGDDTLAILTIPDFAKATSQTGQWPAMKFWRDPSMRPFTEKFMNRFNSDLVEPLQRELGFKFSDYSGLVQGQMTLGITRNGWGTEPDREPGFLFLADAGPRAGDLKTQLETFKKKWTDSGKTLRTETIRGQEFSTLIFSSDELGKSFENVFPDPKEGFESLEPDRPRNKKGPSKVEWFLGQSESLLVLGNSASEIEKLLARQSGGSAPSLMDQAAFSSEFSRSFRSSMGYAWINLKSIIATATSLMQKEGKEPKNELMATPPPDKIMAALGLNGLESLSGSLQELSDGTLVNLNIQAPASARKGILKLISFETKDAAPPAFVPADTIKFSRLRLDLHGVWKTLESTLADIQPQMASVLKLLMDSAGKEQDPGFDLRQNLIANLGDDIITYQKEPRGQRLQDLSSPPTLVLVSSPNAEQLASAVKALTSLLPQQGSKVKEREFLGRTLYSIDLPSMPGPDKEMVSQKLTYVASGGYVAFSVDTALVEEYLRGNATNPLKETSGLIDAAQKVGGMDAGMFGYENDRQTMRAAFQTMKNESATITSLFDASPLAGRLGVEGNAAKFKDWIDFSLLPDYEKVMKYFYLTVYGGKVHADGLSFKVFSPNPPGL